MTVAIPSVAPLCRLHAVRGDPGGTHGTFATPLFVTVKTGRGRASVQQQRVEWAVVQSLHFGELRGNVQKWLLLPQVLPLTGTRTLTHPASRSWETRFANTAVWPPRTGGGRASALGCGPAPWRPQGHATTTATGARRRRGLLLARGPPFCPFKPLHPHPGLSFPPWEHRKSLVQIK